MDNSNKTNNITDFPTSRLKTNWPFSTQFTHDLFTQNKYGGYLSFTDFLVETWINQVTGEKEFKELKKSWGYSDLSDDDEEIVDLENESWPKLKYPNFFIENSIVFYKEIKNQKSENVDTFTEKDCKECVYSLNNIDYQTLISEATRFYIKHFFKGGIFGENETFIRLHSVKHVWGVIFCYLLFSPHSFSIRKVLEEENYMKGYENEIITSFWNQFFIVKSSIDLSNNLKGIIEENSEAALALKEKFHNVFFFSNLSTNKAKELVDNFFVTKNFDEIVSYYEKQKNPLRD